MPDVFGAVAREYDSVRPGYPAASLAQAIGEYAGGAPDGIVELGSGTGKGTEVLALLGAPLTCVEPDRAMSDVLRERFPQADVVTSTFEDWTAPAGGVPMIACALAWHWLDEATRNQRAHAALRQGGVLAVFGHRYGFAEEAQWAAIDDVFRSLDLHHEDKAESWFHDDIVASGRWSDVQTQAFDRRIEFSTERYLSLHRTFSPNLLRTPQQRETVHNALRRAVDDLGGVIRMDLRTTLVLARRAW